MRTTFLLLFCTLVCVTAYTNYCENAANPKLPISSHPSLVVWTYDSFEVGTAESDIFGPYARANNMTLSDIVVCRKQSVALLDALHSIPSNFLAPHVVMGLDNVLEFLAPQGNFTDFVTTRTDQMVAVVNTLGHFQHMKPFDYGLVGVYFNISQNPELYAAENNHTFNLQWFVQSGLIHKFVAISPLRDTAGLAFLMWTIAELGDPQLNITGKIDYPGGWRSWWISAFNQSMTIAPTWQGAFDIFAADSNIVNMMSSYGSSPAYDWCTSSDASTRAIVSWYNNTRYGWAQVEAVALVRNSTAAWNFIDYVLAPQFQSQIALANYMNPVNLDATAQLADCYKLTAISPTQASLLNLYIPTHVLTDNLQSILNDWKTLYTKYYISNITIPDYTPTSPPSSPSSSSSSSSSTGVKGVASMIQPMMMMMMGLIMLVAAIM